jgi:hypothetical protein
VFGGDSQYYYLGRYDAAQGDVLKGEARVIHYNGPVSTAFGTDAKDFKVIIEGRRTGIMISGHMYPPENPVRKLAITFTRRESLA